MEYASSVGVSRRRPLVGVGEGEVYWNMRRRVGVVGAMDEDEWAGRVGDAGRRGEGGVTSL